MNMPAAAVIAAAVVCAAASAPRGGPDLELLGPRYNLVSNCSFEALDDRGRPAAWELYAQPENFFVSGEALHGRRGLGAKGTPGRHTAARQRMAARAGEELTLEAWVRVDETDGEPIRAYLEFQDEGGRRLKIAWDQWDGEVGRWTKLSVTAAAPKRTRYAVAIVPYLFGQANVVVDCVRLGRADGKPVRREAVYVRGLRQVFARSTWVKVAWESNAGEHTVMWKRPGIERRWRRAEVVREKEYSIVMLRPDSDYEVRVVAEPAKVYDPEGRLVETGRPAHSRTIVVRTRPWEARRWAGFRLWPTVHLNTFADGAVYPCIEAYKGRFYIVEVRGCALYVSCVVPETLKVEWTKLLVERAAGCYQGLADTCVFNDRLWVVWNRQATGRPGYSIEQSRQYLTYWDFSAGKRGPIVEIRPTQPGCGTWEGGIEVYRDRLWVVWMEVWLEQGRRRTRIVLGPYDEESGFGEPVVWRDCPTVYPYGPSISPFGAELALVYSDLAATERDPTSEPLLWARFDGSRFGDMRVIRRLGRNRYAKGVQVGRSFVMAYKCNTRWTDWGYMFHDIALTKVGPGPGDLDTIYYVDDMKYNSSPDMTVYKGDVYVVYTKFEHAYGRPEDPARCYGTFIGKIEPEVKAGG